MLYPVFLNDIRLVTIQQNIEYNFPIPTKEGMLPSNSNKIVKKASIKKVSAKKETSTKVSGTFFDKEVTAKKTISRKASSKTKLQKIPKFNNLRKILLYLFLLWHLEIYIVDVFLILKIFSSCFKGSNIIYNINVKIKKVF